jgi:hypothetical protein
MFEHGGMAIGPTDDPRCRRLSTVAFAYLTQVKPSGMRTLFIAFTKLVLLVSASSIDQGRSHRI